MSDIDNAPPTTGGNTASDDPCTILLVNCRDETIDDTTLLVHGTVTAFEIIRFLAARTGLEPSDFNVERVDPVDLVTENWIADYELRWTGDDFNNGGGPNGRRLQFRRLTSEEWKNA